MVGPVTAAASDPTAATPAQVPMAPGRAVLPLLVLLVVLVLSPPRVCGAALQPGQWVWGAAGRALPLPREKRDSDGQDPGATTATPGHGHAASVISSDKSHGGSVPPPAPGTNASLLRVPTTADPMEETESPDPDLLPSSASPPAPGPNTSLLRVLGVPTTAHSLDETDSPDPDLLPSSAPPPTAPGTTASLPRAPAVPTTADPMEETDSPDLLPSSAAPPAVPGTTASLPRALAVPTTADPMDETDPPDPDLLLGSEPATPTAPQQGPGRARSEAGTAAGGPDSSASSTEPPSAAPRAPGSTATAAREVGKAGGAPGDTTPAGTAEPWDPSGVMGKCLLALLLLGLVAATFLLSTGVLGALLWRRARTGQRRLSRTEMVCISSLLADSEAAAAPRPVPARRHKRLHDGSAEPDGDNLTLSSFLPEHS